MYNQKKNQNLTMSSVKSATKELAFTFENFQINLQKKN